jgi:hypothetical protein
MLKYFFKWYTNKSLILTILIFLPKFIVRPIYLLYKTYTDCKIFGELSYTEFRKRFACYRNFILNLDKEVAIKIKS